MKVLLKRSSRLARIIVWLLVLATIYDIHMVTSQVDCSCENVGWAMAYSTPSRAGLACALCTGDTVIYSEQITHLHIWCMLYRIKSSTEQHRIVTDSTGILGRCVTELMWCVRQQDIECSRVYSHDLNPDKLSRRVEV